MQTQDFTPVSGATRTILLGRNRLNPLAENRAPVVKSFDSPALRPFHTVRKANASAPIIALSNAAVRIDHL